jgi:hypothetical protein
MIEYFESLWMEVFNAQFKVMSTHLSGEGKRNHDKPQSNNIAVQSLKPGLSEPESGLELRRSISLHYINKSDHIQPNICRLVAPKLQTLLGKPPFRNI